MAPSAAIATPFPLGLPLRRDAWNTYELDGLCADLDAVGPETVLRRVATRHDRRHPDRPVGAEFLPSAGLLFELMRELVDYWIDEAAPEVLVASGPEAAANADRITERYHLTQPLAGPAYGREVLLLDMAAANPALAHVGEWFGGGTDDPLTTSDAWSAQVDAVTTALARAKRLNSTKYRLHEALDAPIQAHPHSLPDQIAWILEHFGTLISDRLKQRALVARGSLLEELTPRGGGPPTSNVLTFDDADERERFTKDRDWMAQIVLIAKLTHVWLSQLSRTYDREITRLDQIPDQELDRLARWGFTGLWLIGLWERSTASADIKRRAGNPDALSSAYSLYDYTIAHDLGGEEAYQNLKARCWQRGIRMAADMVPNHTGIHSKWMLEHPDRFLSLREPPYPGYSFNGPNLSPDPRVHVRIEDSYWTRSDAPVVFQRVDTHSGDVRYIYHGNDGTDMPWNDTAQLDFLNPDTREAVIQEILAVARRAPVIRFDAAMTLARRHVRRLWHPRPGEGGVPSRARYGVSEDRFDAAMPNEFWREVVDRIQSELPDTLLLAEAFWMMEGYFVRTLGMHRVYNSAFMNTLKMEDNAKYRTTVKNVLALTPRVLQRFVNFMNNPDERTAVEQFGKGDKYFGVALLMVTMPGLPMFGHGQIEAFTERYGMEYARAYWEETPDQESIARHQREIFPLMRRRHLFAHAHHFAFYDFDCGSHIDEDVYAYSNRADDERALVVYHNAYKQTSGWVRYSAPTNVGTGDEPQLVERPLHEALGFTPSDDRLVRFLDQRTGLHYLRPTTELADRGLYFELGGYQAYVLLDWAEVDAADGWGALMQQLGGRGTHDLDGDWRRLMFEPITRAWSTLTARLVAGADAATVGEALRAFASAANLELAPATRALTALETALDALADDAPDLSSDLLGTPGTTVVGITKVLALLRLLPREDVDRWGLLTETPALPRLSGPSLAALRPVLKTRSGEYLSAALAEASTLKFIGANIHEGVRWFVGEQMESLLLACQVADLLDGLTRPATSDAEEDRLRLRRVRERVDRREQAVRQSRYRLYDLLAALP